MAPLGIEMVSLEELLGQSDLVTIHVVLTRETRKMIQLARAQDDEEDRVHRQHFPWSSVQRGGSGQALNEGIIAGAALDVFDEEPTPMNNPLRQVDPTKLTMTPHIIGNNPGSLEAGQRLAAQSILSILDGKPPDTVVNPKAIPLWKERFGS